MELGESGGVLAPVEFPTVNDDTGNCRSVATNPLGSGVYDDVRSVFNGSDEVPARSKCVVNLFALSVMVFFTLSFSHLPRRERPSHVQS